MLNNRSYNNLVNLVIIISLILIPMDPVLFLPYEFLGLKISISRMLLLFSFFLLLFNLFWKPLKFKKTFNLLFLWTCFNFFTYYWSFGDFKNIIRNMFLLIFINMVVILSYSLEKQRLGKYVVYIIIFLSIIFAFIEQLTGYRLPAARQHVFFYELTAFYINPAHLGSTLSLLSPWILNNSYFKFKGGGGLQVFIITIVLFVILRTGTKGSLLSFFVAFIFNILVSIFSMQKKVLINYIVKLIVTLIIIGFFSVTFIYTFLPEILREKILYINPKLLFSSESYISRENIWTTIWTYVRDRIFIGYGIGSFNTLFDLSSHNLLLELWFEGGFINLSLFLILLFYVLIRLMNNFAKNKVFVASLLATIPIFFTLGSFLDFWAFWIVLGICIANI
ncbi:MAG: hypothetical protein C0196_03505 [Dictyoglomus turgidum]|nr:MAG: hypothetical protein C0196_03505 [Dictyoglomus turgidum]